MSKHIFLVGAKSLGAYGGYETFINKLTEYHQNDDRLSYHVACKANGDGSMDPNKTVGAKILSESEFIYNGARCFRVPIPMRLGAMQAIYYDIAALNECCKIIEKEKIRDAVVYIMACRIGPFMKPYYQKLHKLGAKVFLNPDGHEWKRAKWSAPVRKYWKISEQMMVKYSDLVICDSITIEKYIHKCYDQKGIGGNDPKTTFIAYGAETRKSKLADDSPVLSDWYAKHGLVAKQYYLVVGRFVPENNYETMIREFMRSKTQKDFVLITNVNEKFLAELEAKLHFKQDPRIKFVGTVYEQELLMKIRANAYGYFHGHEVGGTNPSLLEALGSTDLNLLLDVGFNKEVAEDAALYWNKENGDLAGLIEQADRLSDEVIRHYGDAAKKRISDAYSWEYICSRYADVFLG